MQAIRVAKLPELPPFVGGAVGYAGYDTVRYVEHLPNAPTDDRELPDLSFAFYDHMVVFDNVNKTVIVVVLADVDAAAATTASCATAYDAACRRVDRLVDKLSTPTDDARAGRHRHRAAMPTLAYQSNFTQPEFEDAVRKCVEYIRAGDIFQVVISQRLAVPLAVDPFEIYRTLRVVNPSPFMFYLRTPEVHAGRQLAGDHGPRRRRQGDGPPAGRHAPPRRAPRKKTSGWPRSCWPTRRSGPST